VIVATDWLGDEEKNLLESDEFQARIALDMDREREKKCDYFLNLMQHFDVIRSNDEISKESVDVALKILSCWLL
jgi:hypothetical protein